MPLARYSTSFGLAGCYLPDSHGSPLTFATRRDLMAFIRDELANYDMPACLIRELKARRLWQYIKRHGSSTAHFRFQHKGYELAFHGLTEEEAREMDSAFD